MTYMKNATPMVIQTEKFSMEMTIAMTERPV